MDHTDNKDKSKEEQMIDLKTSIARFYNLVKPEATIGQF